MNQKLTLTMGFALITIVTSPAQAQSSPLTLNDVAWISGCWKARPDEGRFNNVEQWSKPFGNAMLGTGMELKGGKLVSWEHMKIEAAADGKIILVIKPHNQKEAAFTLTSTKPDTLSFENPQNDFPQKVSYRKEKDGAMEIRVDGKVKDVQKAALFPMMRMPCE
jgi:Domain of unknown function (DUF6265)